MRLGQREEDGRGVEGHETAGGCGCGCIVLFTSVHALSRLYRSLESSHRPSSSYLLCFRTTRGGTSVRDVVRRRVCCPVKFPRPRSARHRDWRGYRRTSTWPSRRTGGARAGKGAYDGDGQGGPSSIGPLASHLTSPLASDTTPLSLRSRPVDGDRLGSNWTVVKGFVASAGTSRRTTIVLDSPTYPIHGSGGRRT